jgi:hypothetical protein
MPPTKLMKDSTCITYLSILQIMIDKLNYEVNCRSDQIKIYFGMCMIQFRDCS